MKSDQAHRNANSDDGDDGVAADRQDDRPERAPAARAVDLRGLHQLAGMPAMKAVKMSTPNGHREGRVGEDQPRDGVEDARVVEDE